MVARGIWFDSSGATRDIRILHRDKRRIEDKPLGVTVISFPEITSALLNQMTNPQYEIGDFFYVQISPSAERGVYKDVETYFNAYKEAINRANEATKKRIIWFPKDKLQPNLNSIIAGISKKNLLAFYKMNGWNPLFIDSDFSKMIEYGYIWAKRNNITAQVSDYADNEIAQKRSIMLAMLNYFGPRPPRWSGGFSTGSSAHGPYKE